MLIETIQGRPLIDIERDGNIEYGVTVGSTGTIHKTSLKFATISVLPIPAQTIIKAYVTYFGWDEGFKRLCCLGIINNI
jgi:hypothetical protein